MKCKLGYTDCKEKHGKVEQEPTNTCGDDCCKMCQPKIVDTEERSTEGRECYPWIGKFGKFRSESVAEYEARTKTEGGECEHLNLRKTLLAIFCLDCGDKIGDLIKPTSGVSTSDDTIKPTRQNECDCWCHKDPEQGHIAYCIIHCKPKYRPDLKPKTEGRECKSCHPEESKCECNATHHWTCPQHPSYRYSGSPKQDTWGSVNRKTIEELLFPHLPNNPNKRKTLSGLIYKMLRSELQNQRQEIVEKLKEQKKVDKPKCNCPCPGPFCNDIVHPCSKPKEHTTQNQWMYVELKREVIDDILDELEK